RTSRRRARSSRRSRAARSTARAEDQQIRARLVNAAVAAELLVERDHPLVELLAPFRVERLVRRLHRPRELAATRPHRLARPARLRRVALGELALESLAEQVLRVLLAPPLQRVTRR